MSAGDGLDLARLREALPGFEVHGFEVCGSTNVEAARLAAAGVPRALVVAEAQTAGRGRQGRAWHARPGEALTFSLLLRPPMPPRLAPLASLAAGVAIAERLDLRLKWPNDVLDPSGRKVCGVLAEAGFQGARLSHLILGVGLNVWQAGFPPELPNAASLAMSGRAGPRTPLLVDLVQGIDAAVLAALQHGPSLLSRWRRRAVTPGQRVRVAGVEGVAEDVREDGALLVRTETGLRVVLAGDVEMVGEARAAPAPPQGAGGDAGGA